MQKAQENDQGQDPVEPAQPYPPGKLHNRAHAEPCRRKEIEACEETEQVRLELSHLRQAPHPDGSKSTIRKRAVAIGAPGRTRPASSSDAPWILNPRRISSDSFCFHVRSAQLDEDC